MKTRTRRKVDRWLYFSGAYGAGAAFAMLYAALAELSRTQMMMCAGIAFVLFASTALVAAFMGGDQNND